MRTTLTLDDDVARMLEAEAHRTRRTFKDVVNDAIRRGLAPRGRETSRKIKLKSVHARLAPGIDPTAYNRLADELEVEALLSKRAR